MLTEADAEIGCLNAEMKALAEYICDGERADVAELLHLYRRRSSRIIRGSEDALRQALRREMICSAIYLFHFDVQFLLRDYSLKIQLELIGPTDQVYDLPLGSHSPGPDLIERLLLLMVFREGCSLGDCAVLLACSSVALLEAILDRAIGRLR
jgi:hypothetical protein